MLFRTATPDEDVFTLDIDGEAVPVRLARNANARRYILRIRSASRDVVLTLPPHGTAREARDFAGRHTGWIRTRLRRLPQAVRFEDGAIIPFRGTPHLIEHRPDARGTVWLEPGDPEPLLEEDGLPRLCVAGRYLHMRRRLRDWLKAEAEKDLAREARRYAKALDVTYKRIQVRDQKTRWGSCSQSGTLAFSWRLILAPPFVLSYLAAHEITHVRHMNHSRRFWATLRDICPDSDRAEAWLNAHGRTLHGYDL